MVNKQGIAVGCGPRHLGGGNGATCAHRVFHQHGLPQSPAHGDGDHARHHIGGAACSKGHNQADSPVRKRRLRYGGCANGAGRQPQQPQDENFLQLEFETHDVST